ncbi:MAG: hypothetical protein U9R19_01115, partial [Bacteroidota bacterium]|nr:hypothetical protein [Bacteroidota bacterium]
MKHTITLLIFLLLQTFVLGQGFNGILINKADGTTMPFAVIKLKETGKYKMTNKKGEFRFNIPPDITLIHLQVLFVGCHTTIQYKLTKHKTNMVYADCKPTGIDEIVVEGFAAKDIVKKAVAAIPLNYFNSSYASNSFHRQYVKINGTIKNLIEVQAVVMFNISTKKNEIKSNESIAIEQIRRSKYYHAENLINDDFNYIMYQNPVYHLKRSSINPRALDYYTFKFDTTASHDTYIIEYTCSKFTSESHSVGNYLTADIQDEGWESGKFTIDAHSYAFIK